jgi:hypothetical protein
VESTTEKNNKIYPMDEKSYFHPKCLFIQACQLEPFQPRINETIPLPNRHFFYPSHYPIKASRSSFLTPLKGPQIFTSTIVIEFFCILDLSIIASSAKMKGVISKDKMKRLAKEQQEMEKVRKEQGKTPKYFQSKPKSLESELNFEVEGKKKRGKMLMTLKGRGKIVFTQMDKFERWVRRRDVHWAKHVGVFGFINI